MPDSLNCFRDYRDLNSKVKHLFYLSNFLLNMRYPEFENILSPIRMNRYLNACNGQTKKAMTLYRLNLDLSREFLPVISCFEVALRNGIDKHCSAYLGNEWILKAVLPGGIFDTDHCLFTCNQINLAMANLQHVYTHDKLIAELSFGFWRYLFAPFQFNATGRTLLRIFPARPCSSPSMQLNHTYIFKQLRQINKLRNRIAHHEPICFEIFESIKSTAYARATYDIICELLSWMSIDKSSFLYGLDHILDTCNKIDAL
jgi:hypothetical protein